MNTANLRKRPDEATPRPWAIEESSEGLLLKRPGCKQFTLQIEPPEDCRLIVELVNNADELLAEVERLRAENRRLLKGLHAVDMLIGESYGVAGLHLNGDVASWGELRSGGRLEEWLRDFDAALEEKS